MNDLSFAPIPSVSVSRTTLSDFEQAFRNLRPKINTAGNSVKITQRGTEYIVPLSQPRQTVGFTR